MRKTILVCSDQKFRCDFGSEVDILYAARKLPGTVFSDYICSDSTLNGTAVIVFLRKNAPSHSDVISSIDREKEYLISTFDD